MGQEIVSHKETEKHEVIYYPLKIKGKRQFNVFEFQVKVLSDDINFHKLESNRLWKSHFSLVCRLSLALRIEMALSPTSSALFVRIHYKGLS